MIFIWIVIIIFILICICYCNKLIEPMTTDSQKQIIFGTPYDGSNLVDDDLFRDVVVYENDTDPYAQGGKIGLEKCISECNGNCIEFGVTGKGICFPRK
jgi:hypothetical protein